MPKPTGTDSIRIRGARQNNLKNLDLDIPARKLVVITGLSGSGKSSLAFDTLFAEGQRRYVETFSPYARQFFDRMDKPAVDSIEGIPPAIAIEQRNAVRSTRSTVGTMTEVCDYMKVLWPYVSTLHCRKCGDPVRKDSAQTIWEKLTKAEAMPDAGYLMPDGEGASPFAAASLNEQPSALGHQASGIGYQESGIRHPASEFLITFHLALSDKLAIAEQLALVAKQGFQRLLVDNQIVRIDDALSGIRNPASGITVIQDRIKLSAANRSRFHEACEQAFHFGHGKLAIHELAPGIPAPGFIISQSRLFSSRFHCAPCDLDYREPSPALFSFNHPVGACPECKGFGRVITIDYDLAIPDRSKSLADGAVKPWQTGVSADCQADMIKAAAKKKCPTKTPFRDLAEKWQRWVIDGDPGYGTDKKHEWPHAWYGVKGYFRWLESKSYKMHVRVLLSRYRAYTKCHVCDGKRLQPDALLFRIGGDAVRRTNDEGPMPNRASSALDLSHSSLSLSDFYLLPIRDALAVVDDLAAKFHRTANDPLSLALKEVRGRLGYLAEVGLGYITLDRSTRTLSGGETARVNLTTCLGSRLVNTLFVLDEPSVGLHPRDTDRLVKVLQRLRDQGNTVVVVEHESNVMRAADQIIDLGPGHGESGGGLIFQGTLGEMLSPVGRASAPGQKASKKGSLASTSSPGGDARPTASLTAEYLSGRKSAAQPKHRPIGSAPGIPWLQLRHATRHNLVDVSVDIPLRSLVCVSGVSGSGKSTLIREILLPLLEAKLGDTGLAPGDDEDEKDDEKEGGSSATDASLSGHESLGRVVLVDQSLLGRTPRSNPAVYIGAFEDIREIFANTELAKQRGLNASAFSFNSGQGQCERCRGAGFEKIEMQFLSDIFVRCPDCNGRRYREHILEVKVLSEPANAYAEPSPRSGEAKAGQRILPAQGSLAAPGKRRGLIQPSEQSEANVSTGQAGSPPYLDPASGIRHPGSEGWSIADLLDASVDEAILFLDELADSKHAKKARTKLALLQEVGLGYLRVGQPINTLSGGESQRLKLVSHLAEFGQTASNEGKSTLFLFDEPTTGLHFEDVRILIAVFQRLVDAGHSVLIIEHNLDVIRSADWVIDLGPEAGDAGGRIVATGTPAEIAAIPESRTGQAMNSDEAKR